MRKSSVSALETRLLAEIRSLTAEIERLTGLSSQWNGQIEVVSQTNRAFGGKTFSCLVRIRQDIAETRTHWQTMLHEAFHCFSTGRSADASLHSPGYEEGVVESLLQLYRDEILRVLNVELTAEQKIDRDINSAYTVYVKTLETMRESLHIEARTFYLDLLSTPLEQREVFLREQIGHSAFWKEADFRRKWREWEWILTGKG